MGGRCSLCTSGHGPADDLATTFPQHQNDGATRSKGHGGSEHTEHNTWRWRNEGDMETVRRRRVSMMAWANEGSLWRTQLFGEQVRGVHLGLISFVLQQLGGERLDRTDVTNRFLYKT